MTDREIMVSTDVVADLTAEEQEKYRIAVIPAEITWEGQPVAGDISPEEFIRLLKANPGKFPHTAVMGPEVFKKLWRNHDGPIISIHPPRGFSRLIEDARIAARKLDPAGERIFVVPGLISIAQAWLAIDAGSMAEDGVTADEIARKCTQKNADYRAIVSFGSVDYLRAGGRASYHVRESIKDIALMLGSKLKIKPVLEVTPEGIKTHKVTIRKKGESWEQLKEAVWKLREKKNITRAAVVHSAENEEEVQKLADELKVAAGLASISLGRLRLFTICHGGPDAVAFCAETENY
jgi:DegV family protein with EDD domain